jgi:hypothetical protein
MDKLHKIEIELTGDEAEEVLFALAMRAKQRSLTPALVDQAVAIGRRLSASFEPIVGADPNWFDRHLRNPIDVTIRTLKVPATEDPRFARLFTPTRKE